MPQIRTHASDIDLDEPTLVEGFPGVGLVGKIATDHLIETFEMRYYASVECEGLPRIAVYHEGEPSIHPPVRLYASEEHDLLALQSDVPIAAAAVENVAGCLTSWIANNDVNPVYLSGFPAQRDGRPELFGIATAGATAQLEDHEIDYPNEDGAVSGPTGALLSRAAQLEYDSIGLIVESNPQFPDPEAARVLIEDGLEPITGLEIDVRELIDRATEIREQRERLAQRMQDVGEEASSQARPMQMFQ